MAAVKDVRDLTALYQLAMILLFLRARCTGAGRLWGAVTRLHTPESSTVRDPRTLTTYTSTGSSHESERCSHKYRAWMSGGWVEYWINTKGEERLMNTDITLARRLTHWYPHWITVVIVTESIRGDVTRRRGNRWLHIFTSRCCQTINIWAIRNPPIYSRYDTKNS